MLAAQRQHEAHRSRRRNKAVCKGVRTSGLTQRSSTTVSVHDSDLIVCLSDVPLHSSRGESGHEFGQFVRSGLNHSGAPTQPTSIFVDGR